jgi:predicted negative regulator of RcsB-dependent stress response
VGPAWTRQRGRSNTRSTIRDEPLDRQGRTDELAERADAGDEFAADRLATLLVSQGRVEDAVILLRRHVDAGSTYCERYLVKLTEPENIDDLTEQANTGDVFAIARLAELLAEQGRTDEAIAVRRSQAGIGVKPGIRQLAQQLAENGHVEDAIAVLRKHFGTQVELYTVTELARYLAEKGHAEDAIAMLRPHADTANHNIARCLADLLAEKGRANEAIAVLRPHAQHDNSIARRLAVLLADQGHIDELADEVAAGTEGAAQLLRRLRAN